MASKEFCLRDPSGQEVIIIVRSFAIGKMAEKMPEQQSLMRVPILLDRYHAAEATAPLLIQCGREAFSQSARTSEKVNDRISILLAGPAPLHL